MKYEELREYIISKMRPDKAHGEEKNYQPVVIRFLNQTPNGIGKKDEIVVELQNENQGSKAVNAGTLDIVIATLIRNENISHE